MSDDDVERIARRVVEKLVFYALVIVTAVFAVPMLFFPLLTTTANFTRGMPYVVAVAITASVIAIPLVALIWVWGRRAR
jgi:NADH:ubiquinone oxidoreductase subunit 3 (subunit A)